MTTPRHFKVVKDGDSWKVLIGNIQVGAIELVETQVTGKAYRFLPDSNRAVCPTLSARTMKGLREDLIEKISKDQYMAILDEAYKAGYER